MNKRFHNALQGVPQATPPVWFMRQAGRYHAHYQALRKEHSFMELCKNAKLAAEVARGPVAEFDFDVSILFSDLLFPLEAMGMGLTYDPSPKLGWQLNDGNVNKLKRVQEAIHDLAFQKDALEETRKVLPKDKSLIGFVGGPWTLFSYAVEGEHKGNLIPTKTNFELYRRFCEVLLPLLEANIDLQLKGGAEVVMMFDTAAGELSAQAFREVVEYHVAYLASKFPGKIGYYSKNTVPAHLTGLRQKPFFAGFGVDHRWDLPELLKNNQRGFVQGNFDQAFLFCNPEEFEARMEAYFEDFKALSQEQRRHWVSALGHGVLPQTPEANVKRFVQRVREVFV